MTTVPHWMDCNCVCHGFHDNTGGICPHCQPEKYSNMVTCGDANPKGNVYLTSKGGCRQELPLEEAYRCTGCGVYFHKDCIFEHFKLEKRHDYGRHEERKLVFSQVREVVTRVSRTFVWDADASDDEYECMVANRENLLIELLRAIYKLEGEKND